MLVRIDTNQITDWDTFHEVFRKALGFPAFYGRNMDAWIDCLSSLDSPTDGMTSLHVTPPKVLTIRLDSAESLKRRLPDIFDAVVECSAFVNWRRIEMNEPPLLALAFHV